MSSCPSCGTYFANIYQYGRHIQHCRATATDGATDPDEPSFHDDESLTGSSVSDDEEGSDENMLMAIARRETGAVGRDVITPLVLSDARPALDDRLTADYVAVSLSTLSHDISISMLHARITDAKKMGKVRRRHTWLLLAFVLENIPAFGIRTCSTPRFHHDGVS